MAKNGKLEPDSDESGTDLFSSVVVTSPAREVESGWPSVLNTWRNRLLANDWQVKVGTATSFWPTTYAKNGNVKRAEHEVVVWWINAAKPKRYITIAYETVDGKIVPNRTTRMIRGIMRLLSDAEMKDAVEAEDG